MSKSLEALEELCSRCYVESEKCTCHSRYRGGECSTSCEYKELLEKDLERKTQLEKENQDLKIFVDAYANARDELLIRNQYLEEENQKYLEELKRWGYPETPIHISKYKLLEIEHAKLKAKLYNLESHYELLENFTVPNLRKAIKILKDKYVDIELLLSSNSLEEYNHNYSIPLTQEEYDLLKEVLK